MVQRWKNTAINTLTKISTISDFYHPINVR